MNTHADRAEALFKSGYNCAQSLIGAFEGEIWIDFETSMKLASSFGGGMGRLREVCGALTGLFMVVGLLSGYSDSEDHEAKTRHYQLIQDLEQAVPLLKRASPDACAPPRTKTQCRVAQVMEVSR